MHGFLSCAHSTFAARASDGGPKKWREPLGPPDMRGRWGALEPFLTAPTMALEPFGGAGRARFGAVRTCVPQVMGYTLDCKATPPS